jgi:hypothetical protein
VLHIRFEAALRLAVALCVVAGALNLFGALGPYRDFERFLFSPESAALARSDQRAFEDAIARVHREPLLTPYAELALAYGAPISRDELAQKIELTARAMRFAPVSVVVYRHALLLALAGDSAAGLRQLEQAIRVYPGELGAIDRELRALAREHPAEMTPLLELTAAKSAERRAPAGNR